MDTNESQLLWVAVGAVGLAALWFLFLRPASEGLHGLGFLPKRKRRKRR